jgi:carboxyl-terminal processing protease
MRAFLALASLTLALAQAPPPEIAISPRDRLKVFDKTWEIVNKKFYDPKFNGVDWPAMKTKYRPLAEAAADKIELRVVLNNLVSELHVSHSDVNSDVWFGNGLNYVRIGQQYVVRLTYAGSPAHSAGIERGWVPTGGAGDCNAYGRKVTNTFLDLQGQQHSTEIPCVILHATVEREPTVARMLDDTTFYIRFPNFTKEHAAWFTGQVTAHRAAAALVIDLRSNPGGALEAFQDIAKLFFPEKTEVAIFRSRKGSQMKIKVGSGQKAYPGRVFVLTNAETGSAAEVFSAALQETGRGVIVGRATKKGVLGADHFNLPNGFVLHIPLYDFHTPKGTRLEGRGVIPDQPVEFTLQDFQENKDPDLDRVRELLAHPWPAPFQQP